jgi:hypothetical protein
MNMFILLINILEWALIAVIGLCSTLAFASSSTYVFLHKFLLSYYPELGRYFIAIIWGFIALIGIFSVSFRRKGGGRLTWLALIIALPSILAFDKLNIPGVLGINFELTTELAFWQVLALAAAILTAYLLLNFMRELKLVRFSLGKKGADSADIEKVAIKSHQILLLVVLGALVLTALVSLLAANLESWLLPYFSRLPWNVVLIGLFGLLILAIYIYWLGTHHSSSGD